MPFAAAWKDFCEGRRKKEEGKRKKEEGRRKREEGMMYMSQLPSETRQGFYSNRQGDV
jgi:hypothetical protein